MDAGRNEKWAGLVPPKSRVRFGFVTARAERILIVGTGPSLQPSMLSALTKLESVHVIAVNKSIQALEKVDTWFTLDPDKRVLPLMRAQRDGVEYMAAVPDDYGEANARVHYHRVDPIEGMTWLRRLSGDGPLRCRYGLSEDCRYIHTGNSLWGALGAAYFMWPKKVALLGLDATSEPYGIVDGGPQGSLEHLPDLFASALPQLYKRGIEVRNGSLLSRVTCFPKLGLRELLNWLVG